MKIIWYVFPFLHFPDKEPLQTSFNSRYILNYMNVCQDPVLHNSDGNEANTGAS